MRNRALRTQLILGPCDQVTDPREGRDALDQLVPDRAERFPARSDSSSGSLVACQCSRVVQLRKNRTQRDGVDRDLGDLVGQVELVALNDEVVGMPRAGAFDPVEQIPGEVKQGVVLTGASLGF